MWSSPGGDLVEAGDDGAGNPRDHHRVEDVFSLLAQVGAGNGHRGATLQQAGERLNLRERGKPSFSKKQINVSFPISNSI